MDKRTREGNELPPVRRGRAWTPGGLRWRRRHWQPLHIRTCRVERSVRRRRHWRWLRVQGPEIVHLLLSVISSMLHDDSARRRSVAAIVHRPRLERVDFSGFAYREVRRKSGLSMKIPQLQILLSKETIFRIRRRRGIGRAHWWKRDFRTDSKEDVDFCTTCLGMNGWDGFLTMTSKEGKKFLQCQPSGQCTNIGQEEEAQFGSFGLSKPLSAE